MNQSAIMQSPNSLELSDAELAVRFQIGQREGRPQAISLQDLAAAVDLSPREVQHVIKHLIELHRLPIGSATSAPHGYYWITGLQDQERAEKQLAHRIISTARRLARLKQNTPDEVLGQLALDVQRDEDAQGKR